MSNANSILRDFAEAYLRRRYSILFYALLFTMVVAPLLSALELSGALFESLVAASLLAAIIPADTVKGRSLLLVLMIIAWLARPLTDWLGHTVLFGDDPGNVDPDWDACHGCCPALGHARYKG